MWTERLSGKRHKRSPHDHRSSYERDRTRVIHAPAFRRLQRKTQILGTDEGDFHRTRLTHSLEVASIARSIVKHLSIKCDEDLQNMLPDDDLITSISLLHDIGHPPFGHGGEVALNYMMRNHGGFESNGQTLRLLTKLESSYGQFGLDLTRRTLLGILKYPTPYSKTVIQKIPNEAYSMTKQIKVNNWKPPKAYLDCEQNEVDWILYPFTPEDKSLFQSLSAPPSEKGHGKSQFKSLDCSIMDLADDIAYGVHDLEDAIHLKLIQREQIDTPEFQNLLNKAGFSFSKNNTKLIDQLFHPDIYERKLAIGELVNFFITSSALQMIDERFEHGFLKYNVGLAVEINALLANLQQGIYQHVIDSQEARTFEYGGQNVVLRLFEAMNSNPTSLLDNKNRLIYQEAQSTLEQYRVISDCIANMTDEYAYRMHERLFGFNTRTIFERL